MMPRDKKPDQRQRTYEHPIPSRDEIMAHMEQESGPLSLKRLANGLKLKTDKEARAMEHRLKAMVRDGQLIRNRANEFCLTDHLDLVSGVVLAHRDGFGFLRRDDGEEDVYLSARQMQPLWNRDRVAVRISPGRRGGMEGHVVEILERARSEIVGRLRNERGINYVLEEGDGGAEALIARGKTGGAKPGNVVRVEILEHPTARSHAIGRIVEIVGQGDEPGIETDVAILVHGIPSEWPEAVVDQAEQLADTVPAAAKRGREDLRSLPLVTIDGADAKDFDDAVYCERTGKGWRLIVAIADVAHYVEPGSPLDQEATARGTSVYFPDRVVPMLPEKLSNGLCSLRPDEDRLCLVCDMQVSAAGKVERSKFYDGLMRSHARLTYTEAWDILEGKKDAPRLALAPVLAPLREVYRAFAGARKRRGAIDFDLPETKIRLGQDGQVDRVEPVTRLQTHKLIEECMIAANVEAAKRLRRSRIPSLFRVHEPPDADRIEELFLFLGTFDIRLPPPNDVKPKDLTQILEQLSGRPEKELVDMMVLRSMNQALYQPKNAGHFGLALPAYAHFTSPIRRYPDLLVHRALKWLNEHGSFKGFTYALPEMSDLGERTSRAERRADEAVWDVEEQLKCRYMRQHVGDYFDVVVTSVVAFGLFVRVPNLGIEGLVHVSALPRDYYHREPSGAALTGERTGRSFGLAETLRVKLTNVDLEDRKIDFVPDLPDEPETEEAPSRATKGAPKAGRKRRRRRG